MDLSKIVKWEIPEGDVLSVANSSGEMMWMAPIVDVKIHNYCGSGAIDINQSIYDLVFSTSSTFDNHFINEGNLNSYSQRLYVKLIDSAYGDAPAEACSSCYIASGSQMSSICDDILEHINQGTGYTWDEVKTKILNTTPEVFKELTVYGGDTCEIDLSKYTPTQMMGNPKYIEPNYPLYIICGNSYAPAETAEWDLKTQTVDAGKTAIPVVTNADLAGAYNGYLLGNPNVSWMYWDTSIETDATICLVVDENTSTSDRSGTVSLYEAGGMLEVDTVTITQKGKSSSGEVAKQKPYWNLKSTYNVDDAAQSITPEIIITDPDNVGWGLLVTGNITLIYNDDVSVTTSRLSGTGTESTGYKVYTIANPGTTSVKSEIKLFNDSGALLASCVITQKGSISGGTSDPTKELVLDTETLLLDADGQPKNITAVYTGTGNEAIFTKIESINNPNDTNLNVFPTITGSGTYTLLVSAQVPNSSGQVLSWKVTFITPSGYTATLNVYQFSS